MFNTNDIVIYEDWEQIDDIWYYKWRATSEKDWHYRATALKDKPFLQWKYITPQEHARLQMTDTPPDHQRGEIDNG